MGSGSEAGEGGEMGAGKTDLAGVAVFPRTSDHADSPPFPSNSS